VPRHGARELQQAVEAALLGRLEGRGIGRRRRAGGELPGMDHGVRQPILRLEIGEQRVPDRGADCAGLDGDHLAVARQPLGQPGRRTGAGGEDQPAARRCFRRRGGRRQRRLPGREIEPVRHVRPLADGLHPRRTPCARCALLRLNPISLALERIGGQRDTPPRLAGVEARPVELQAGQPETADSPMPWPSIACGRTPQLIHRRARATSTTNSAGRARERGRC
jgi:hypothetical protein